MEWLTLTGEADTDITAGSKRLSLRLLGQKSNIKHESQTITAQLSHDTKKGMMVMLHFGQREGKRWECSPVAVPCLGNEIYGVL